LSAQIEQVQDNIKYMQKQQRHLLKHQRLNSCVPEVW